MLKRLKKNGASCDDLQEVYEKQIHSVLELAVPVWSPGLTLEDSNSIERVQKSALQIILESNYVSYEGALQKLNLESLRSRREKLCLKFAIKSAKHQQFSAWFKPNDYIGPATRSDKPDLKNIYANKVRYEKSPIPYLTTLLNDHTK